MPFYNGEQWPQGMHHESIQTERDSLASQVQHLQSEVRDLTRKLNLSNQEAEIYRSEAQSLRNEAQSLRECDQHLRHENNQLRVNHDHVRDENNQLRANNDHLSATIDNIGHSVTASLPTRKRQAIDRDRSPIALNVSSQERQPEHRSRSVWRSPSGAETRDFRAFPVVASKATIPSPSMSPSKVDFGTPQARGQLQHGHLAETFPIKTLWEEDDFMPRNKKAKLESSLEAMNETILQGSSKESLHQSTAEISGLSKQSIQDAKENETGSSQKKGSIEAPAQVSQQSRKASYREVLEADPSSDPSSDPPSDPPSDPSSEHFTGYTFRKAVPALRTPKVTQSPVPSALQAPATSVQPVTQSPVPNAPQVPATSVQPVSKAPIPALFSGPVKKLTGAVNTFPNTKEAQWPAEIWEFVRREEEKKANATSGSADPNKKVTDSSGQ